MHRAASHHTPSAFRARCPRACAAVLCGVVTLAACTRADEGWIVDTYQTYGSPTAGDVAQRTIERLWGTEPPRVSVRPAPGGDRTPTYDLGDHVAAALRAADLPKVVAVVGPESSAAALAVAPVYRERGLPHIVPTATSPFLDNTGGWTFRMAPTDSAQGAFMARFASRSLGARSAVLAYIGQEYGVSLRRWVMQGLEGEGMELRRDALVPLGEWCDDTANPYADHVRRLLSAGESEVVIVAGHIYETGCIARALHDLGSSAPVLAGDGAVFVDRLRRAAGPGLGRIYAVTFWHPDDAGAAGREFVERFRSMVGREPHYGDAMAFDAFMVAATAIRAVGADRRRVRAYLASLGVTRPPYSGITGPVAFTPHHPRPMLVVRDEDGRVVVVERAR